MRVRRRKRPRLLLCKSICCCLIDLQIISWKYTFPVAWYRCMCNSLLSLGSRMEGCQMEVNGWFFFRSCSVWDRFYCVHLGSRKNVAFNQLEEIKHSTISTLKVCYMNEINLQPNQPTTKETLSKRTESVSCVTG